jgi:hypothetical protein
MEQDLPERRRIVVDGSNIATEGRTLPSLAQLDEAIRSFLEEYRGFTSSDVTVVVDASFGHRIDPSEVTAFDQAVEHGEMITPPAGALGRGDGFILRIAEKSGALVLSNDSFQEFHAERPWLFEPGRLIGGKPVPGVGWIFTPRTPVRGVKSRSVTSKSKRGGKANDVDLELNGERSDQRGSGRGSGGARASRGTKATPGTKATRADTSDTSGTSKAAKTTKTTKGTKAAKAAKVVKATKTTKAAKTTKSTDTAKTTKATKTAKTAKRAATATTERAEKPEKATKAGKTTKATKAAKTTKAGKSATTGASDESTTSGPTKGSGGTSTGRRRRAGQSADDDGHTDHGPSGNGSVGSRGSPDALNEPMTFLTFVANHPVGSTFDGTVVSFTSHGAHVDVDGMLCHVPLRGLAAPPPKKARQVLAKGEIRLFTLVSLDAARRRAELTLPGIGS